MACDGDGGDDSNLNFRPTASPQDCQVNLENLSLIPQTLQGPSGPFRKGDTIFCCPNQCMLWSLRMIWTETVAVPCPGSRSRHLCIALRIGSVSVAIRRFIRSYIRTFVYLSWTRTSYIARDRFSTDRVSLCL